MFRWIKELSRGLQALAEAVSALEQKLHEASQKADEAGPLKERIEALELSRHAFEAECEALWTKADARARVALNAEQRTRTAVEATPDDDESGDELQAAYEAWRLQAGDADSGNAQGLLPLPADVGVHSKEAGLMAKFGV
jgi:chromosome segregation ATPase